jgi:cholinesterase
MAFITLILGCMLLAFVQDASAVHPTSTPLATVKNGTLSGFHVPGFNQVAFFGIPFVSPPVGDLRLRRPASFNKTFSGVRDAMKRSLSCPGYGNFAVGLDVGEDCLTLDIVLPEKIEPHSALPVVVWIYGGGIVFLSMRYS